jgi:TnpA family transposase
MASIERTAYPRIPQHLNPQELMAHYRLSKQESDLVRQSARGAAGRLSLAALLKARQLLNYFPTLDELPDQARRYLIEQVGVDPQTTFLDEEFHSTTLHRYRVILRSVLSSRSFSDGGREQVETSMRDAARTMSDPSDLINTGIEVLVADRIELPAFSTLNRIAGNIRQAVHEGIYTQATALLDDAARSTLDTMLVVPADRRLSEFAELKQFPRPPTLTHVRDWTQRLVDIDGIYDPKSALKDIPHTKIRQFAAEAASLDVGDLRDVCTPGKRYTLLLCFLQQAQSDTRDQLVEMFVRRMRRSQRVANERLQELRESKRETEESLIEVLAQVLRHAHSATDDADLGSGIRTVLESQGGVEALGVKLQAVTNYHDNNFLPLLWPTHAVNRTALLRLLGQLDIASSTQDSRLLAAYELVRKHPLSRQKYIPDTLDIGFASQRWQTFVRVKNGEDTVLDHRSLEVCVLIHMANAFQSGDLFVRDSGAFGDYREQLLPWSACEERLADYSDAVGLASNGSDFVDVLRERLERESRHVDAGFPANSELTIDHKGVPHLMRQAAQQTPAGMAAFEKNLRARMPERHLLDVLKRAHHWAPFTRHFGPLSGSDPKIDDATRRYLFTVFGYGCNMGASQTAKHAPDGINRQMLRRLNSQHISVATLEAALRDVIDEYARFELPNHWGQRNVAIADGTQMELRENNLLAERHIRYGGHGAIAYHHISATYIALFSNFVACGVWEAVYILDGLLKNTSTLDVDTVHADTHGQSEPVFGLAHLLGIKLLPRMRTWNDAAFYRPSGKEKYEHIDALFTDTINWELIETHWQDMMQVVLSIQAGKVLPSMLLRKLSSHNRQNKLYLAFRELGRVERTLFLLRYVSENELRHSIRAETTKVESYNDFLDWIGFGGPIIKSGDPEEQLKQVKYMDLVANAVMLNNVADMTAALTDMMTEGQTVNALQVSRLSPYWREHIRRFGQYFLDMEEELPPGVFRSLKLEPENPL